MIPAVRDVTVESTIEADEVIKYGLDADAADHFMSILAGIYKDEARAVIREYITNALDSHIEAGQTRAVEIKAPNRLKRSFEVRDYGVGLSREELRSVYSRFGKSTKRTAANDGQAGSLGIGSKVALAYAGQFQVIAIKHGRKVSALVSLDDMGQGQMEILSDVATDEHNGVTVIVPVNTDVSEFNKRIDMFHMFVPEKITVDGNKFSSMGSSLQRLDADVYIDLDNKFTQDYVVMGNVYYPVDANIYGYLNKHFRVALYVPMRAVQYTPSREDLNYTRHTRATLDQYKDRIDNGFRSFSERVVRESPNKREAFNAQNRFHDFMSLRDRHPYKYNGVDLPAIADVKATKVSWNVNTWRGAFTETSDLGSIKSIDDEKVFLINFNNKRFTKVQALKVAKALDLPDNDHNRRQIFMIDGGFDMDLTEGCTVLDWEVVKLIKLNNVVGTRTSAVKGGKKVKTYLSPRNNNLEYHVPDTTKNIWYGAKSDMASGQRRNWYRIAEDYISDNDEFYYVTDTEQKAFLSKYPTAQTWRQFHVKEAEAAAAAFTPEDFELAKVQLNFPNLPLLQLIKDDILDPELAFIANQHERGAISQRRTDLRNRIYDAQQLFNKVPRSMATDLYKKLPQLVSDWDAPQDLVSRYPVLSQLSVDRPRFLDKAGLKMFADYVNTVYTQYMTNNGKVS